MQTQQHLDYRSADSCKDPLLNWKGFVRFVACWDARFQSKTFAVVSSSMLVGCDPFGRLANADVAASLLTGCSESIRDFALPTSPTPMPCHVFAGRVLQFSHFVKAN